MKHILVVEDDAAITDCIVETITNDHSVVEDVSVVSVKNGAEALSVLENLNDKELLILLDIMMPVMDGPTFLTKFSSTYGNRNNISIVVMSASPGRSMAFRGTHKLLNKPFCVNELTEIVGEFCKFGRVPA